MALVDALLRALPAPQTPDPRLLQAAILKPRMRGIAGDIDARARARTDRAEGELRRGLRDARALHSRERRLVGDVIRDLARYDRLLDAILDAHGDVFLTRWLGWMVVLGADAGTVRAAWAGLSSGDCPPFERLADLPGQLVERVRNLDPARALGLVGSLPESAADSLLRHYGPNGAAAFIQASNTRAPLELRANIARTDRDKVRGKLGREGLQTSLSPVALHGLVADNRVNLDAVPTYKQGLVEVQDAGSQVLAELVDPDDGPIVDFCAGAGGKTLALAAAMGGKGRIVALDVRASALNELRRRCKRARVHSVTAVEMAPSGPLPWQAWDLEDEATRVLVDAPCSGSGVLRRHPEYRWRLDGAAQMAVTQRAILERAAPLVAVGGRLIYGTCSVFPEENEQVVDAFVADHPEFELMPVRDVLGAERAGALSASEVLRLAPHTHGTDGFFGAVLVRTQ